MLSVDTNVVVRLLAADDPAQFAAAEALFTAGPVWISKTVLLETEWVLSSRYRHGMPAICGAFAKLLGLENAYIEDKPGVRAALSLTAHGVEFADALHLAGRPAGVEFVTFDRTFLRRAKRAGVSDISDASTRLTR